MHDPSLAPEGKHIVTIDVNSQPYTLRDETWDDIKEDRADRAIAAIAEHFPTLPAMIEHRQVLSPLDLERLHRAHRRPRAARRHGARPAAVPAPGPRLGGLPTPIRELYLCGAGTHPGGGVTGANGRNAARDDPAARQAAARGDDT